MDNLPEYRLPTPDAPSGGIEIEHWVFPIPNVPDIQAAILGALFDIGYWSKWYESGDMTPYEVVWLIKEAVIGRYQLDMFIGHIVPVYSDTLESHLLLADGSTHQRDDYPILWERTPASMRTATTFDTPDLTGSFLLGESGSHALRSTGGEEEHTLTIGEIPSHDHGFTQYTFGVDIESVGVPDPTGVGNPRLPESTDNTGGGNAHNNMPPFYTVRYAVIASV